MRNDVLTIRRRVWREQAAALGAEKYDVVAVPRDARTGRPDSSRPVFSVSGLTAEGVESSIPRLIRENAAGSDVYIKPVDEKHHFIMIDDLTRENVEKMKSAGVSPCAVWETSKGNFQAVVKIPRSPALDREDESESIAARRVQEVLTAEYGGDSSHRGETPLRMCGFNNKKPAHGGDIVYLRESSGEPSAKAARMVARARAALIEASRTEENPDYEGTSGGGIRRFRTEEIYISESDIPASVECLMEYERVQNRWLKIVKERGWEIDYSAIDLRVTEKMLRDGWHPDSVKSAMEKLSPGFPRSHGNPKAYSGRTIKKALSRAKNIVSSAISSAFADASRGLQDDLAEEDAAAARQQEWEPGR